MRGVPSRAAPRRLHARFMMCRHLIWMPLLFLDASSVVAMCSSSRAGMRALHCGRAPEQAPGQPYVKMAQAWTMDSGRARRI